MTALLIVALGAAFTNPEAIEHAFDNSPQAARIVLEQTLTQEQIDAVEATLLPPPTPEAKEADLKTALSLVTRIADDVSTDTAVLAIQAKLDAIEVEKPDVEPLEEKAIAK